MRRLRGWPFLVAEAVVGILAAWGLFGLTTPLGFSGLWQGLGWQAWVGAAVAAPAMALLVIWKFHFGRHRKAETLLAAFFALCVLLDRSFVLRSDWGLLFASWADFAAFLWAFASLALLLDIAVSLTRAAVLWLCKRSRPLATGGRGMPAYWRYLGILLACWLPYLVLQAPGHTETTAGQQIRQVFGDLPYTYDNPIFHTLLLKLLIQGSRAVGLSDTLAILTVSLSQAVPLALTLVWSVMIVRRLRAPRALVWGLLAFYCLCPLFAHYAFFIVKDVPFATAVLLFTCELAELMMNREAFASGWRLVAHGVIGIVLCLMRNAAIALYALAMLGVLLALRPAGKALWRIALCSVLAIGLAWGATVAASAYFHVQTLETRQAETRSLQCQTAARVVKYHGAELNAQELATIDACLPLAGLAERYHPEVSDPVKDTWRVGTTQAQKAAFDALTLRLALRYPDTAAQAFLQMAVPYLALGDIGRFRAIFDYGFSNVESLYPLFKPKHLFSSPAFRYLPDWFQHQPLVNFFCCSGFAASLLMGSAVLLLRARRYRAAACCLPAALVLLGCMLSPVAGYTRYALPFLFCAPFLAMVAIAVLSGAVDGSRNGTAAAQAQRLAAGDEQGMQPL